MSFEIDLSSFVHWLISIGGFLCSLYALWNDRPSGKFSVSLGREFALGNFNTSAPGAHLLRFEIVNKGRRPITITSFGGQLKDRPAGEKIWFSDATKELFKTTTGRTLNESEVFSYHLPLSDLKKGATWDSLKVIWAEDSHGTRYKASSKQMKKLIADYKAAAAKK